MTHVYPDLRAAPVFAALEADATGQASQLRAAAFSDLARIRYCNGALALAWLTARPGVTLLTAVEFRTNAQRLGEDPPWPGSRPRVGARHGSR